MINILTVSVSIFGFSTLALAAHGHLEKFQATENDGTAREIRANTNVDESDAGPISSVVTSAPLEAPAKPVVKARVLQDSVEATITAPASSASSTELSELKRQNSELLRRIEVLEQVKTDKRKEDAISLAPALAATAATPAPKAVAPLQAAPIDPLEGRIKEKSTVTQEARADLAKQDSMDAKRKTLREQATKFDAVPDRFIPELAERLKFANDILKRWGRAYDYRVTTLNDFRKILASLEAADEKATLSN